MVFFCRPHASIFQSTTTPTGQFTYGVQPIHRQSPHCTLNVNPSSTAYSIIQVLKDYPWGICVTVVQMYAPSVIGEERPVLISSNDNPTHIFIPTFEGNCIYRLTAMQSGTSVLSVGKGAPVSTLSLVWWDTDELKIKTRMSRGCTRRVCALLRQFTTVATARLVIIL